MNGWCDDDIPSKHQHSVGWCIPGKHLYQCFWVLKDFPSYQLDWLCNLTLFTFYLLKPAATCESLSLQCFTLLHSCTHFLEIAGTEKQFRASVIIIFSGFPYIYTLAESESTLAEDQLLYCDSCLFFAHSLLCSWWLWSRPYETASRAK